MDFSRALLPLRSLTPLLHTGCAGKKLLCFLLRASLHRRGITRKSCSHHHQQRAKALAGANDGVDGILLKPALLCSVAAKGQQRRKAKKQSVVGLHLAEGPIFPESQHTGAEVFCTMNAVCRCMRFRWMFLFRDAKNQFDRGLLFDFLRNETYFGFN